MRNVYNKDFFDELIRKKLSYEAIFKIFNQMIVGGEGDYRHGFWAYAGDILWCRDLYGRYYKLDELTNKAFQWYSNNIKTRDFYYVLSKLYMILLMIHPFKDGNGRTAYTMVSYLAYLESRTTTIQIPLTIKSNRIHKEFRVVEHLTYKRIETMAYELAKSKILNIDRRVVPGYSIGNYVFSSLLYILFEMDDYALYDEIMAYFKRSVICEFDPWIIYLKRE